MNVLLNDALAWSAELGLPLTRPEALALAALALAVALVMVRLLFKLRWRRRRRVSLPLARVVRGPKLMGYGAILLFFGGFGAWAVIATLASAAIAPGVVSPDGSRKTIEHLEGGIVREIYVGEGDQVQAGQVLVSLEDVKARAEFEELRERFVHLVTSEARLLAEQAGADSIASPRALEDFDPAIIEPALTAQHRLFASRRATLEGREQILGQRILQLEAEIGGLREVIAAQNEQLGLIGQEIEGVQTLYEKGLSRLPKLLELKRARADVRANRATNRAQIARHQQAIGENSAATAHHARATARRSCRGA